MPCPRGSAEAHLRRCLGGMALAGWTWPHAATTPARLTYTQAGDSVRRALE